MQVNACNLLLNYAKRFGRYTLLPQVFALWNLGKSCCEFEIRKEICCAFTGTLYLCCVLLKSDNSLIDFNPCSVIKKILLLNFSLLKWKEGQHFAYFVQEWFKKQVFIIYFIDAMNSSSQTFLLYGLSYSFIRKMWL